MYQYIIAIYIILLSILYKIKNKNGLFINNNKKYWYKNNLLHCEDGPAYIDGDIKSWYKNGKLHNLNGPAYIDIDHEEWWINGKCHRENEPAIIKKNNLTWYKNGEIHRDEGPAIINLYGKMWFINGKRHREDGPAYVNDYYETWYIEDVERSKEWVKKYVKIKNKHKIAGVMVSDYWKIREIILRWRYDPNFKCVQNRLKREFNTLFN